MQTHDEETRRFFKHSSVQVLLCPRIAGKRHSWVKQKVRCKCPFRFSFSAPSNAFLTLQISPHQFGFYLTSLGGTAKFLYCWESLSALLRFLSHIAHYYCTRGGCIWQYTYQPHADRMFWQLEKFIWLRYCIFLKKKKKACSRTA